MAARNGIRFSRAANCLLIFAGLVPIGLVAWFVITKGRQVPIADQWWDSVYIAMKTQTGTLKLEDFFVLSWGHRTAITRIITALSTIVTHYDAGILRFVAFIVTLLNLGLTMLLLRGQQCLIPAAFFFSAILLFSLYETFSWLDYNFSAWQQALFFVLLGLLILQRMRPGWLVFVLLLLSATAASLSCASGLVAWISLPFAALGSPEFRRPRYLALWILVLISFLMFYTSDYAVSPFRSEEDLPSLSYMLRSGLLSSVLYPFRFQAIRFDINRWLAIGLTLIGSLALVVNWWRTMRSKEGIATASLWGSLALFSLGNAALVLFARGPSFVDRYSPAADGFWLAIIALALLVLARRPPAHIAALNIGLLIALVVCAVQKDIRSLQSPPEARPLCDRSIVDYPLYRGDLFHKCFMWSEDQSVYHLAALRLSVFRDELPRLILPRVDAPVISDMPNRWLSVYVRDYMMAGLPQENLYSVSPVPGLWPEHPEPYTSPFHRGEWPTDILPRPLRQTWASITELAFDLSVLTLNQPVVWYLNTPETEANFSVIERALNALGYAASKFPIMESRYGSARFGLWCFERNESTACSPHKRVPS